MRSAMFCLAACLLSSVFTEKCSCGEDYPDSFKRHNLVAWCIVPFDAKQRSPRQRAEMLTELGIKRVAYDWRQKHIAEFEEEIRQYQDKQLEYFAFWSWHDSMQPLIKKYRIKPQIWVIAPNPKSNSQHDKVVAAAKSLLPMVEKTRELGLKLGIYNHGGWNGQPENMVAICRHLQQEHDGAHVGIVYNFHHGHEHTEKFATHFREMLPFLMCVNLNGMVSAADLMKDGGKKILPIGSGSLEKGLIQTVVDSGYSGPVGILDHRSNMDAKISLQQNLRGLHELMSTVAENE